MNVFGEIWNWLCDTLYEMLKSIIDLLPDSPFKLLDNTPIQPYLKYINWVIPLDFIVDTLSLWLIAVAGYYTYSVILRALRLIKYWLWGGVFSAGVPIAKKSKVFFGEQISVRGAS